MMEFSIETEANNVANSMSNRPGVGFARRRASVDNDGSVGTVRNQERKVRPFDQERRMPHYTGDLAGTRYSPLDQINADNFNKLEVAWRFKTDNLGTRPE